MKKVLLVIDGMAPRQDIFDYALQFCQRMKAQLSILQIVDIQRECMAKVRKGASRARNYFEKIMMAQTFAEANAPDIAAEILSRARANTEKLIPEIAKAGVPNAYEILSGDLGRETVDYVNRHKDIVLTILDARKETVSRTGDDGKCEPVSAVINRRISVPLVVAKEMKTSPSTKK